MSKTYSGKDIQRYAGLAGVRKRSSVYIGPNDSSGLWTILREVGDNVLDITTKGWNKKGHIVIDPNKKGYWVIDEGPGFPVEVKKFDDEQGRSEKLNTFYVATGLTHAGSNFNSDLISRGVNGVGIKCTNAMSKVFSAWTFRDGSWYAIHYRDAKVHKQVSKEKPPKIPGVSTPKKGTIVYFEPDMSLFLKGSKLEVQDLIQWATISSYLVPKIELKFTNIKGKTKTFVGKGLDEYLKERSEELKANSTGKPFIHRGDFVDVAISFANAEGNNIRSYTNGLFNSNNGEHFDAIMDALVKSLKPFKGKLEYTPKDLQDGLIGLVNVKLAAPLFDTQTKQKLIDKRAHDLCFDPVFKAFEEFWKKNKTLAVEISKRASLLRKKTADFMADKKLIKNVKSASKGMSDKFADVNNSKTPIDERELYIVEGDSAGGTAKKARDKSYQATFAIRGKPLNVLDATMDKINNNKEVSGILAGIGIGSDSKNAGNIRFGKVIFLADPDVDGYHINCLLLGLFWKFTPHLFDEGKIYMLKSPEYLAEHKGNVYYGMTVEDIQKQVGSTKVDIQHIKGWGELTPDQMAPIAFDKGARQLIKILPPKTADGKIRFEALLSGKGNYRKELLGIVDAEEDKPTKKAPASTKRQPAKKQPVKKSAKKTSGKSMKKAA